MKRVLFAIFGLVLAITAHSQALEQIEQRLGQFNVRGGYSMFGYTLQADYRINSRWGVRAIGGMDQLKAQVNTYGTQVLIKPLGFVPVRTDLPAQHEDLDVIASVGGLGLVADYYFDNAYDGRGFRLSGGVMKPFMRLDGSGVIDNTISVNGQEIDAHSIDVSMWVERPSPYIGFGYRYTFGDNPWMLDLELGALTNAVYGGSISGVATNASDQAALDQGLRSEMETKLRTLEGYPLMPWVSISLIYRW